MATIKDQVKESLVGTVLEPSLSTDAQATFERHAKKDESNGELYMTEDDFVDAIAPANEDYVGYWSIEHVCFYLVYYQSLRVGNDWADLESLYSIKSNENSMPYFSRSQIGERPDE